MSQADEQLDCWAFAGWEPDRHYRRMGSSPITLMGNATWRNSWRETVCSKDTLKQVRDVGVNILITHCFKGYGWESEADERDRLKQFIDDAHELGFKLWGYVQGGSLFYETLLCEQPTAMDWVACDRDGKPVTCRGAYYRLEPCFNQPGFRSYLQTVVTNALTQLQFDGIHLDNSYFNGCYCDVCCERFRAYLQSIDDLDAICGIADPSHVQPPPLDSSSTRVTDPLQMLWTQFIVDSRIAFLQSLNQTIKHAKPDAVFHHNPGAFVETPSPMIRRGVDPSREGQTGDVICYEATRLPEVTDSEVRTLAPAYHMAEASGYRLLNASWDITPERWRTTDTSERIWANLAEEFSHASALLGASWLLQPNEDGTALMLASESLTAELATAVGYFNRLHAELSLVGRKPWAPIAVMSDGPSMSYAGDESFEPMAALVQALTEAGLPWCYWLDGKDLPDETVCVVAWSQTCLSTVQQSRIETAKREGVHVVCSMDTAKYNEWHLPRGREHGAWLAATSDLVLSKDDTAQLVEYLRQLPELCSNWQIDLPHGVLVNVQRLQDGRMLVHLRDQSGSTDCRQVTVNVGGNQWSTGTAHSPKHEPRVLELSQTTTGICCTTVDFTRYALLVFEPNKEVNQRQPNG